MKCSNCGLEGHNVKSCPDKQDDRDIVLWMKIDGLTKDEAIKLQINIIKAKSKIAPRSRGTSATGTVKELPNRIRESLNLLENKDE